VTERNWEDNKWIRSKKRNWLSMERIRKSVAVQRQLLINDEVWQDDLRDRSEVVVKEISLIERYM
jgi:hypothetical protein